MISIAYDIGMQSIELRRVPVQEGSFQSYGTLMIVAVVSKTPSIPSRMLGAARATASATSASMTAYSRVLTPLSGCR